MNKEEQDHKAYEDIVKEYLEAKASGGDISEKLYNALIASHESEVELTNKCAELTSTNELNAKRVQNAIKLTQEDSQTINILRKEIDKAWQLVEQAKEKEEKARTIIHGLKNQIEELKAAAEVAKVPVDPATEQGRLEKENAEKAA